MKTNSHIPLYEDYVSFETAKLLKEKGFDWLESPFYSEQDRDEWRQNNSYTVPNEEYNPELPFDSETLTIVAPHVSIQTAMKWLREVHNIHIELNPICTGDSNEELEWHYGWAVRTTIFIDRWKRHNAEHISYEEACAAAIKYCLENLI